MIPPFAITPSSDALNPAFCANARVLTALRSHADKTGRAYPRVETLAEETGLSVRTVQRALRRLAAAGLIKIKLGGRYRSSNVYVIVGHGYYGVTTLSPQGADGVTDRSHGVTDVTHGVTQRVTHEQTHLTESVNKEDARARAAPDGRARLRPEGMEKGEAALLEVRLGYYERTCRWDPDWGPLPPLLEEGGVAIEVEEDDVDQAEPELRETGS
jgi:DNA-binding transcriptional MocR family regulator